MRTRWAIVGRGTVSDIRGGVRTRVGHLKNRGGGATHADLDLETSLAYVDTVFTDYLRYGRIEPESLRGKRVLETGPGDSPAVALRFLAAGAAQVVCLDRFFSWRAPEQQRVIVQALVAGLRSEERVRLEDVVLAGGDVRPDTARLRFIEGVAVERAAEAFRPETFDLIVSRAVMEHVYDPDAALNAMDRLLAPGGVMLHKIDFRDHGRFSDHGHHPLTFLTIPSRVFRWIGRNSANGLNRRRMAYYRRKLEQLGYERRLYMTHVTGTEDEFLPHPESLETDHESHARALALAREIRPRLAAEFASLSDDDLIVQGVFLCARKPLR